MYAWKFLGCLIVCIVCLSSCKRDRMAGDSVVEKNVRKTFYSYGTLHKEMVYEDGAQNGVSKEYYRTGKVFQEVMYVDNLREGWARRYYESGILSQETPYENDKMHGVQKRYRRSGQLMAEIPYYQGHLCTGLKEYTLDGKLKARYPWVVVESIDNTGKDGSFTLRLSMSDGSRGGVEYFIGPLIDGKYIHEAGRVADVENGIGELTYSIPKGAHLKEEIVIIAKVKTNQSNYYITESKFQLAMRN